MPAAGAATLDVTLHLALSADVTVTGKSTFTNLADVERPAENLVGVAQSASQGAITARQLDARPVMRTGEVLETVPGVVISQHSGEGKANQYYLRGFNLDHGTDFATTVAGMPVNMPTHGHGHGYSDLNFLIPELVSGVQFSKGPYFADQGDFATAGAANINYANTPRRGRSCASAAAARASAARWSRRRRRVGARHAARRRSRCSTTTARGTRPDDYRKVNGARALQPGRRAERLRRSPAWAIAARGTRPTRSRARAIDDGRIGRFGTHRHDRRRRHLPLQRLGRVAAHAQQRQHEGQRLRHRLRPQPVLELHLLPRRSRSTAISSSRPITASSPAAKVSHRRLGPLGAAAPVQNTVGVQLRNDDIGNVGLYHTARAAAARDDPRRTRVLPDQRRRSTRRTRSQWTPWLRTLAGVRVDGYRFDVDAGEPANSGTDDAGLVSPKGGAVFGPWRGTELYVNAGLGFHSNDARGATITRRSGDRRAGRARDAAGARHGRRGRRPHASRIPHLQTQPGAVDARASTPS